ncbi:MAG: AzlD domain-containing protein [Halobaculum sp.]
MIAWVAIVAIGIGTFAIRASFLFLYERIDVPEQAERALELVPAAVLSALVLPAVVAPDGTVAVVGSDRVVAAGVALVVAWRTENILATITVGMAVLLGLRWLPVEGLLAAI